MNNAYQRTKQDRSAEVMADVTAAQGGWEKFVGSDPDNQEGLREIVIDGRRGIYDWQSEERNIQKAEIEAGNARLAQYDAEHSSVSTHQ